MIIILHYQVNTITFHYNSFGGMALHNLYIEINVILNQEEKKIIPEDVKIKLKWYLLWSGHQGDSIKR